MTTNGTEEHANGGNGKGGGDGITALLEQIRARDGRVAWLSRELEERTARLASVEQRLAAERITSDNALLVDQFQVFWWAQGGAATEEKSVRRQVRVDGSTHEILMDLPANVAEDLRIDPGVRPGFWEVAELTVTPVDADRQARGEAIRPDLAKAEVRGTAVRLPSKTGLRVYSHGTDPQVFVKVPDMPAGGAILRAVVRTGDLLAGFLESERGLFQDALDAYARRASETAKWLEGELARRDLDRKAIDERLREAQKLSESLASLGERQAEMAVLVGRAAEGNKSLDRLTAELASAEGERRAAAEELQRRHAASEEERRSVAAELARRDEAAQAAERDLAAARAQLAAAAIAGAELRAAAEEAKRLRAESARLRETAEAGSRATAEASTSIARASEQLRDAETEREAMRVAALRAQGEAEALRRTVESQAAEVERLRGSLAYRAVPGLKRRLNRIRGRAEPAPAPPAPGSENPWLREIFDEAYYRKRNADVRPLADVLDHYLKHGWREGRDPSPLFRTAFYRARQPDAAEANALLHYVSARPGAQASPHPLFDQRYYLHANQDVAKAGVSPLWHFVSSGVAEGRRPHPLFDPRFYLANNPDVAASRANPLAHFAEFGGTEGRDPHPLFASGWYLARNPDVARAGMNPLEHYVTSGWREGRDPHPMFSVEYYLRTNPDVARAGIDPLTHFATHGWTEGRDPSPDFDMKFYALSNPGLGGENPLAHFIRTRGLRELAKERKDEAGTNLRLVVLAEDVDGAWAGELRRTCAVAEVVSPGRYEPSPPDYVYAPDSAERLTPGQLASVAMCLAFQAYDFVVVSGDIPGEPGTVVATSAANAVVLSGRGYVARRQSGALPAGSSGRLLKLRPGTGGSRTIRLGELGLGEVVSRGSELAVTGAGAARAARVAQREPSGPVVVAPQGPAEERLPLVLVLPAMLAVGGVERNTIEVMRLLEGRYRFALALTEPMAAEHGSLHARAAERAVAVVDLGEAAPQGLHLEMLRSLRDSLRPDLVWICNGSPWLSANAEAVRAVFNATPIVDQQVYDTKAGWIAHLREIPALRAFDRYIAINSAIAGEFVGELKLDPERVDLIYPMFDDRKFVRGQARGDRAKLGLPEGRPAFAQVGRLTDQKRPLDFLEMARLARDAGSDAHFVLVGSGPLGDACDAFVERHGLSNVTRIPFLDDPSELYASVDGLVISSEYEGLPIVLLEALAMGVPALSTDVGDVRLVLEEYGSGRIVSDLSGKTGGAAMFEAIAKFREELPQLRESAQRNASAVRERFSGKSMADAYDRCFRAARAGRGADVQVSATDGISVIMATYNRRATLERTLRSCARYAAGLPVELLVVDDGSRDDTPRFLEQFANEHPGLIKWRRVGNGGPGRARNLAGPDARYDVLLFMGDDAEPVDARFFRAHLDLHRRHADPAVAFLGKMVWPDEPDDVVTYVMQAIQGHGGEQFGYADFRAFQTLDWRFFYTCNISMKRSLVADWQTEGFSDAFRMPGFEDAELAYRLSKRPGGFRIVYTPNSVARHHHHYGVEGFINRQYYTGANANVILGLHPELTPMLVPHEVIDGLAAPVTHAGQTALADYAACLEGIKAMARLMDSQRKLGAADWHRSFIHGVFELTYLQGYIAAVADPNANLARGYRAALEKFYARVQWAMQSEVLGYSPRAGSLMPRL